MNSHDIFLSFLCSIFLLSALSSSDATPPRDAQNPSSPSSEYYHRRDFTDRHRRQHINNPQELSADEEAFKRRLQTIREAILQYDDNSFLIDDDDDYDDDNDIKKDSMVDFKARLRSLREKMIDFASAASSSTSIAALSSSSVFSDQRNDESSSSSSEHRHRRAPPPSPNAPQTQTDDDNPDTTTDGITTNDDDDGPLFTATMPKNTDYPPPWRNSEEGIKTGAKEGARVLSTSFGFLST
eukprot:CAMPEP_0172509760 /NCGR_PEP_ID=MMETSP1066-20121228/222922_1 /TAXON_ID=671091 /ORGANISM="Coscinodiscus wailesii, Strain CCMP2513" /LENGTH=239 /DNA_ID=CAMNT_0013288407 /DNA_START=201 /DNA_END=916 /DNA_ORIENTATION=+